MSNQDYSHLNWWEISKAKDAQYFTPPKVANVIYECVNSLKPKKEEVTVFDPTAGTGRLLKPFHQNKWPTVGVEYDEKLGIALKRTLNKEIVRVGNILDYYNSMKSKKCAVVVANPPFGLDWDVADMYFESAEYGCLNESQTITIEIINNLLVEEGLVALIVPTSSWTNAKDSRMRNYVYSNFNIIAKITIPDMFKKEYKINKPCDLVFMTSKSWRERNFTWEKSPYTFNRQEYELMMKDIHKVPSIFKSAIAGSEYEIPFGFMDISEVPDLSQAVEVYVDDKNLDLSLSKNGKLSGNEVAMALLDFYDATKLSSYNSVLGKETGLKQCYFSMPSLIKNGTGKTKYLCAHMGLTFDVPERLFSKLKKEWELRATPLFQPKAHELLAYYNYGFYRAKDNLEDESGEIIFKKGKKYLIKPTWGKHSEVAEANIEQDNKGEDVEVIRQIEMGHLELHVFSEKSVEVFPENKTDKIELFLKVFDLPEVRGIADKYPTRVKNWANVIVKKYPYLKDYQAEDLARLLCKKRNYVGYQQGGGKTLISLCYAELRQYSRVLVICQGGLVDNWINEAEKWGFTATALKTHGDINHLLERVKKKDFVKHKTEFFIIGQEFLSLDSGKIFDTWECIKYNKDGKITHEEVSNKYKCSKGHKYDVMHTCCPKCGDDFQWSGKVCGSCGYIAYTYGESQHGAIGVRQYPAYKRLGKIFKFVVTDESQNFANRSLRGEASRAFNPPAKMLLTGTIMKNYVSEMFLNVGWLMNYNNPVFYYQRGDIKNFLDEYGSYEFVTRKYLNEIQHASSKNRKGGRKKLLPAVSNLNRFWKLITPFTVRRLSLDLDGLRDIERERVIERLPMDDDHALLYSNLQEWAKERLEKEFRKKEQSEVNMGVISTVLWKLRYGATIPTSKKLCDGKCDCPEWALSANSWNKIKRIVEICKSAKAKGDKTIVFSALRPMQSYIARIIGKHGLKVKFIPSSVSTNKRFAEIDDFSKNYDVLVSGADVLNRGYNIIAANHVVFSDITYTPEITDQGEFRVIRHGQEKKVYIYYLLSENTIDEDMLTINNEKRDAIEKAVDKKTDEQNIKDLLRQADNRNAELMVAKKILENSAERESFFLQRAREIQTKKETEKMVETNYPIQKAINFGEQLSLF